MTDFQPGEIVNVEIKGARVSVHGALLSVRYPTNDGECGVQFDLQSEHVAVTRVAPAEWPPQVGDLWRSGAGEVFFAVNTGDPDIDVDPVTTFVTEDSDQLSTEQANSLYGPFTLAYRAEP